MAVESPALLELEGITFSFPNGKTLFEDLNFVLRSGQSVGLWSPNGTGKTTLFKIITGLKLPSTGSVKFEGLEIRGETLFKKLRLAVGFVLQHPDDQLFFPEVIDDVAFGPLNQGLSEEEAKRVSENVLKELGILHLSNSLSFELSGGQKKLVTLACVLSMRPKVLLLDEPTNGLDSGSRGRLIEIINGFSGAKIIISHDPEVLSLTCNRFMTIENGKLVEINAPVVHEHRHAHFYGGTKHTHN